MRDPSPYLVPAPAPAAIFERLEEREGVTRFMLRGPSGYRPVSWTDYARATRHVATWLASEGAAPGARAALFAPNRLEWLCAAYGAQAAAGAMVPIYPSSTAEQAAYVVEHSDAEFVFVDTPALLERVLEGWAAYRAVRKVVLLDDALDVAAARARVAARGHAVPDVAELSRRLVGYAEVQARGAAHDHAHPGAFEDRLASISLDQMSLMLYTSGTSGRPKGVPLTHLNVATNGADWMRALHPLVEEGDTDLLWLPFSHVFGFGEASIGNTLGWTSWLASPADVIAELPVVRPSVLMSVPAYWEKLAVLAQAAPAPQARLRALTGGRLRFCLSGGAGLKPEVKTFFREAGVLIIEGYGLTECSPTLTLNRPDAYRFDSVGKPLDSVELKLAEDGEILARGPSVFAGYHKAPEATAEAFDAEGWFCTGDVGAWTEDGFLRIVDRKKDILVTAGGKNVPPANIERLFQDDPYVAHAVVYGEGKKYLVAGLWVDAAAVRAALPEGAALDGDDARALLQRRVDAANAQLARHETIRAFRVFSEPLTVESGLLTPTLKVKRKAVWQVFGAAMEELYR